MTFFARRLDGTGFRVGAAVALALLLGLAAALTSSALADGDSDGGGKREPGRYDPPLAPSNLVIGEHESRLSLHWTPESWYGGWDVEYKEQSGTTWIDAQHCGHFNQWHLTHLGNGVTYEIRVRTISQGGVSDWLTGSGTPRAKPRTTETGTETLWSSSLNAKRMGLCAAAYRAPRIGCDDFYPVGTEFCSTGLSNPAFAVDGTQYTVKALYQGDRFYGNNAVVFWVAPAMDSARYEDVRLQIEGLTLELGNAREVLQVDPNDPMVADRHGYETLFVFYPDEHLLAWSASTDVSLSRPAPEPPQDQGQYLGGGQSEQTGEVPGQVRRLSVRETGPDRIKITWKPPAEGGEVGRYEVVVSRDGEQLKSKRPGAKKRSVLFRNLESGVTYTISVRAKNSHGVGADSAAQITIAAQPQ